MIIGIEAERANNRIKTGVEHYARQLIEHLAKIDTANKYVLYLRTTPQEWVLRLPQNFTYKVMPFPYAWTQLRVSWEMFSNPPDVLFIPASSVPLIHPKNTVVTVHDLAFRYYPETYSWFSRNFHKLADWMTRHFAKKIIAVTQSTKDDIVKEYKLSPARVSVVHHGYEKSNHQISLSTAQSKYVLFLATLQPRKNLVGLIHAFRQLKTRHTELPHKLLVVGKPGWLYEPILKAIDDNKDIVEYRGHVSDAERLKIMQSVSLLVLPSFYEGFGMQILEAFDAGIPVACSNVSALPEVAGNAAEFFNPHMTEEITKAMENVLLNPARAEELKSKAFTQLASFSWEKCAKQTLAVIEEVAR
ncbi:MAG TPA: glycosyltransferase family 1 protein [Patescibacteria group bacterium]|nr:glycosyltransferase family 1 protein [Patescibacteria group bacterium]